MKEVSSGVSSTPETTPPHTVDVMLTVIASGSVGTAGIEEPITFDVSAQLITATTPLTFAADAVCGASQPVSLTIVNDSLIESDETLQLDIVNTLTTLVNFSVGVAAHTVTIISEDVPNLVFTNADGSALNTATDVVVREGGLLNDSYRVALASQPTDTVSVSLVFDDTELQLAANGGAYQGLPLTLTFDALNWATPQTIDVSALEDYVIDASALPITHDVSSAGDSIYNALRWKRVIMTSYDVRVCNPAVANTGTYAYRFRFPVNGVLINQTRTFMRN